MGSMLWQWGNLGLGTTRHIGTRSPANIVNPPIACHSSHVKEVGTWLKSTIGIICTCWLEWSNVQTFRAHCKSELSQYQRSFETFAWFNQNNPTIEKKVTYHSLQNCISKPDSKQYSKINSTLVLLLMRPWMLFWHLHAEFVLNTKTKQLTINLIIFHWYFATVLVLIFCRVLR